MDKEEDDRPESASTDVESSSSLDVESLPQLPRKPLSPRARKGKSPPQKPVIMPKPSFRQTISHQPTESNDNIRSDTLHRANEFKKHTEKKYKALKEDAPGDDAPKTDPHTLEGYEDSEVLVAHVSRSKKTRGAVGDVHGSSKEKKKKSIFGRSKKTTASGEFNAVFPLISVQPILSQMMSMMDVPKEHMEKMGSSGGKWSIRLSGDDHAVTISFQPPRTKHSDVPVVREGGVVLDDKATLLSKSRAIWNKPLSMLPCHVDLPRLARRICIVERVMYQGTIETKTHLAAEPMNDGGAAETDTLQRVYSVLITLAGLLCPDKVSSLHDQYKKYLHGSEKENAEVSGGLLLYFQEALGEDHAITKVLKASNQSILAPYITSMKAGLAEVLPYNAVRGGWSIVIMVDRSNSGDMGDTIMVTHTKRERAVLDETTFMWHTSFMFAEDMASLNDVDVFVHPKDVKVDPSSSPIRHRQVVSALSRTVQSCTL